MRKFIKFLRERNSPSMEGDLSSLLAESITPAQEHELRAIFSRHYS